MVKLYTSLAYPKAFRSIILGAPASGKGTVSSRIVNCFGVTHISSGDKLRDHVARQTEVGKRVKKYMDEGSFVPDDVIIELISQELKSVRDKNILLDDFLTITFWEQAGEQYLRLPSSIILYLKPRSMKILTSIKEQRFPRTVAQAEKLQQLHPMNHVLNLIVPHSMIMERVKNRWVHLPSGRVYNVGFNDPKVLGRDDVTGEKLSQRNDDKPDVVAKRLTDYVMKTEKVIEYYRQLGILKEFEGDTTDEMWPKIKTFISQCIDGNK